MKFNLNLPTASIKQQISEQAIIPAAQQRKLMKNAAEELTRQILFELNQTSLSESEKNQIERSIEISQNSLGPLALSLKGQLVKDTELGTSERDEQPFLERAMSNFKMKNSI